MLNCANKSAATFESLPGKKTVPFKNNSELLNLLYRLVNEEVKNLPVTASPDEQDVDLS